MRIYGLKCKVVEGLSGKKTINAITMFNKLFEDSDTSSEVVLDDEDSDEEIMNSLDHDNG